MTPEQEQTQQNSLHNGTVLKELSDIKASLAVNTNETANIKASISEIKIDIKDIKSDVVSRREYNDGFASLRKEFADADNGLKTQFTDAMAALSNDLAPLKKGMWGLISAIGLALLGTALKFLIK